MLKPCREEDPGAAVEALKADRADTLTKLIAAEFDELSAVIFRALQTEQSVSNSQWADHAFAHEQQCAKPKGDQGERVGSGVGMAGVMLPLRILKKGKLKPSTSKTPL